MASGQTENCGLNQWAAEDAVLREEFNRDNEKVDAELVQKVNLLFGTYTGNAADSKASYTQQINLGFRPKAVIVWGIVIDSASNYQYTYSAMATQEMGFSRILTISDTGFTVGQYYWNSTVQYPNLNVANYSYIYLVLH